MATTAEQVAALQQQNNQMYIQSAREQMAFQERMSNTAHQREIADMIKAGLNPVLSATGGQGATTPNGAQADVDTSSMVNYLLTEMNNENARAMNNAQVAAQRYAAQMAYMAAREAASAQRYAADRAAEVKPLGFLEDLFNNLNKENSDSRAKGAWQGFLNQLGFKTIVDNATGKAKIISTQQVVSDSKLYDWLQWNVDHHGYLKGYAITKFLHDNKDMLLRLFNAMHFSKSGDFLRGLYGIANH